MCRGCEPSSSVMASRTRRSPPVPHLGTSSGTNRWNTYFRWRRIGSLRLREVLPEENRWWPFSVQQVATVVPERFGGVYLIADSDDAVIYAGESPDLRNALRKHAEGESEEAACIRSHGATQFLFTVIRANRAGREGELRELVEFYRPPCNGGLISPLE